MQRKTKFALAAGLIGAIGLGTLGSVAFADGGRDCGPRRGMGGGPGMMGRQLAERYDANKDGKVTQEEIDVNRGQWVSDFDSDKTGTLSLEEFEKLWLKARFERMVREFQRFDRDGNGQVTLDEYKEPMSDMVERFDRNNDGALSREDRPARGEGRGWRHGKHGDRMQPGPDGRDDAGGNPPPPPPEDDGPDDEPQ
jgi:Ca2+-binding EF-hand superfamily protein